MKQRKLSRQRPHLGPLLSLLIGFRLSPAGGQAPGLAGCGSTECYEVKSVWEDCWFSRMT